METSANVAHREARNKSKIVGHLTVRDATAGKREMALKSKQTYLKFEEMKWQPSTNGM